VRLDLEADPEEHAAAAFGDLDCAKRYVFIEEGNDVEAALGVDV
jgi:hypothetical protein